jgi:multiple sugar transport system substrate-binding protein
LQSRPSRPRRTLGLIATLAAGALALAGCSSAAPGSTAGANTPKPATITFAASTLGDPGRGPGLQKLIDEYNASQKIVTVKPASVPYPTFGQTVLTQMGGGEGPDLVRFDMPEFEAAAGSSLLEPLDDTIDAKKLGLIAGPDKYLTVDGHRYGVVFEDANYGMFYNADLIPTPPTTSSCRRPRASPLETPTASRSARRRRRRPGSGRTSSTTCSASAATGPTARS